TAVLDVMAVRASGDPARAVFDVEPSGRVDEIVCDVLVVGGGTGGISAALAATRELPPTGRVVLLEETDWIGGQLTAQGVSALDDGRLRILLRTKAVSVETNRDRVEAVLAIHLDERRWTRVRPRVVIDATELGDLLALAGAEYVVGAETKAETGEPHAQPLEA